jgi:hypothetical protein
MEEPWLYPLAAQKALFQLNGYTSASAYAA